MVTVLCATCGKPFQAKRKSAKYCPDNGACRKAGGRREAATQATEKVRLGGHRTIEAATKEVMKFGYTDTFEGNAIVDLAVALASTFSTATQKVAASRELHERIAFIRANPLVEQPAVEREVAADDFADAGASKLRLIS